MSLLSPKHGVDSPLIRREPSDTLPRLVLSWNVRVHSSASNSSAKNLATKTWKDKNAISKRNHD
jgi:hypothetical protein